MPDSLDTKKHIPILGKHTNKLLRELGKRKNARVDWCCFWNVAECVWIEIQKTWWQRKQRT